jgi:hypothetical protein
MTLAVILRHPTSGASFSIGLKLEYNFNISAEYADMLFQMTYWRLGGDTTPSDNIHRLMLTVRSDPSNSLPPPSIGSMLNKLGSSWTNVTAAIPILGVLTESIVVHELSVEIGPKAVISGFSITAQVIELSIFINPSLVLQNADLTLSYDGASWAGQIAAQLVIANKYRFQALFILPTQVGPGTLEFENVDDDFTFGELVNLIDPSLDLRMVPLIGGDTLSTIRLDRLSVQFEYISSSLTIVSFNLVLTWPQSLGNISMISNSLVVRWQKKALVSVPSVAGPSGDSIAHNNWTIRWEGAMSPSWHISAGLQLSNIEVSPQTQRRYTVVSGALLNTSGDFTAGDLANSLATNSDGGQSTIWQDIMPNDVTSVFTIRRCALNIAMCDESILGVAAEASWGSSGCGVAALLIQKLDSSSFPWAFAFTISVKNFQFSSLLTDSTLASMIDNALVSSI